MNALEILERLHTLGVRVTLTGDKLRLEPASVIPPAVVVSIRQHKPEIIVALQAGNLGGASLGCESCTCHDIAGFDTRIACPHCESFLCLACNLCRRTAIERLNAASDQKHGEEATQ